MKSLCHFAVLALLGLNGALASVRAQTFPIFTLWTLQQQDVSTFDGAVYTDRVRASRFTSGSLLNLLADAYVTNFPNGFPFGSRLVLEEYDHFQVQAFDGSILLTNVSEFLSYSSTYDETNFLYQGRESIVTGQMSYIYLYHFNIEFNDPAHDVSFTFSGNVFERYSRSTADSGGRRQFQGTLNLTGNGHGRRGDNFFLLSGRMTTPFVRWVQ